jgi:uncharacterized protein (DUF1778 family)
MPAVTGDPNTRPPAAADTRGQGRDQTQFVLSAEDWAAFAEALDRPVQANPALVELFRRSCPA